MKTIRTLLTLIVATLWSGLAIAADGPAGESSIITPGKYLLVHVQDSNDLREKVVSIPVEIKKAADGFMLHPGADLLDVEFKPARIVMNKDLFTFSLMGEGSRNAPVVFTYVGYVGPSASGPRMQGSFSHLGLFARLSTGHWVLERVK